MLLKLWCHELQRVIYDKLTSAVDKHWFNENLKNNAVQFLTPDAYQMFPEDMNNLIFVDFMRDVVEPMGDEPDDYVPEDPKIYEHVDK